MKKVKIEIRGKIIPDKKLEKVKNTKLDNKIRNYRNGGITQNKV